MWQPIIVREGNEPDIFWNALGGKGEYPREKEINRFTEDPHLFTCAFIEVVLAQSCIGSCFSMYGMVFGFKVAAAGLGHLMCSC
ncbi:Gelsolin y domain [Sarracenia purpurea var. burkii]